jgi:hypothetical protein
MSNEAIISILGAVAAILAAVFTWFQVREATKQNAISRKAIQAQTFLMVVSNARELQFSQNMDAIRRLNYKSYDTFKSKESKKVQEQVRAVVDFLNDLMHLVENDYLPEEHVLKIYYSSIRDCSKHLLPWWLNGFRKEQKGEYYYLRFKLLCEKVHSEDKSEIR